MADSISRYCVYSLKTGHVVSRCFSSQDKIKVMADSLNSISPFKQYGIGYLEYDSVTFKISKSEPKNLKAPMIEGFLNKGVKDV